MQPSGPGGWESAPVARSRVADRHSAPVHHGHVELVPAGLMASPSGPLSVSAGVQPSSGNSLMQPAAPGSWRGFPPASLKTATEPAAAYRLCPPRSGATSVTPPSARPRAQPSTAVAVTQPSATQLHEPTGACVAAKDGEPSRAAGVQEPPTRTERQARHRPQPTRGATTGPATRAHAARTPLQLPQRTRPTIAREGGDPPARADHTRCGHPRSRRSHRGPAVHARARSRAGRPRSRSPPDHPAGAAPPCDRAAKHGHRVRVRSGHVDTAPARADHHPAQPVQRPRAHATGPQGTQRLDPPAAATQPVSPLSRVADRHPPQLPAPGRRSRTPRPAPAPTNLPGQPLIRGKHHRDATPSHRAGPNPVVDNYAAGIRRPGRTLRPCTDIAASSRCHRRDRASQLRPWPIRRCGRCGRRARRGRPVAGRVPRGATGRSHVSFFNDPGGGAGPARSGIGLLPADRGPAQKRSEVIACAGRAPSPRVECLREYASPAFSPNGRWIAFDAGPPVRRRAYGGNRAPPSARGRGRPEARLRVQPGVVAERQADRVRRAAGQDPTDPARRHRPLRRRGRRLGRRQAGRARRGRPRPGRSMGCSPSSARPRRSRSDRGGSWSRAPTAPTLASSAAAPPTVRTCSSDPDFSPHGSRIVYFSGPRDRLAGGGHQRARHAPPDRRDEWPPSVRPGRRTAGGSPGRGAASTWPAATGPTRARSPGTAPAP